MRELTIAEREILQAHIQWLNDQTTGQRADLRGADLDFSCWPLWCGSRSVKVDMRLVYQLLAHVVVLDCDDPEFTAIREMILPYAQNSHRAVDLDLNMEASNGIAE